MPEPSHLPVERAAAEVAEYAPFGYLAVSSDGDIMVANPTLHGWLRYAAAPSDTDNAGNAGNAGIAGRPFTDLLKPGARVVWLTLHVPRLYAVGRLDGVAVDLVRSDGSTLPVLLTAILVPTEGRPDVRMTLVDASERRAYEKDLLLARVAAERAEWRMTALQRVTEVCAVETTENELLTEVAQALTVSLEAERTRIWLPSPDAEAPDGQTADPVVAADTGLAAAVGEHDKELPGVVRTAWVEGRPVLPKKPGSGSLTRAAVRFGHADQPLGVLEVDLPGTWRGTASDTEVLGVMGTVVGQALVRVRLHSRLQRLAQYDALTGLPNRNLLVERLEQAIDRSAVSGAPIALLYADLNGFKSVNDRHGHAVGDLVLRVCADRMADVVRTGDTVARIGGDEFVILCEDADETVATEIAHRLRAALTRDLAPDAPVLAAEFHVGVSVGIAVGRPPFAANAASTLVAAGDAAMYDDKRAPGIL